MKNICFISGYFPTVIYDEIIDNSKYNTQHAANKFQQLILEGLHYYYPSLYVVNAPFVGSYPKRYRKANIPRCELSTYKGVSIGFTNLMGIKYLVIKNKIYRELLMWIRETKGEKIIIIYSVQSYLFKAVKKIKNKYRDIRLILIIPDLIQYMGNPKGILYKMKRKRDISFTNDFLKHIDGYIFLTKYMTDSLPHRDKPYRIIEGIGEMSDATEEINKYEKKTIFYSGTLAHRYNIMNLIKAFQLLNYVDVQLIICGSGDCENKIKELAKKNSNIIYKGSLKQKEVTDLQKASTLLINPRTPEGEYTKFSFPSKTIEYFQSGTPVLLYKLPGIPEEYYEYCFTIDADYSVECLAYNIHKILLLDINDLRAIGKRAQWFIKEYKSSITQCEKIVDLINTLDLNNEPLE